MDDALRPSDEAFRQFYKRGYTTWYTHYQQALSSAKYTPHLDLEHAIPDHPRFPSHIDLGPENSRSLVVTGHATWGTTIEGTCPLAPIKTEYTFQISTDQPTNISLAPEPESGFSNWFGDEENHLAILTLAWAYVFSARWVEIVPGASLHYTGNQASYMEKTSPLPEKSLLVDLGDTSSGACRWWAAVLSPEEGWAAAAGHTRQLKSPWSTAFQSSRHFVLNTQSTADSSSGIPASFSDATKFISNYVIYHNISQQSHAAFMAALMLPTAQVTMGQVLLPTPCVSTGAKAILPSQHNEDSQPWGNHDAQLDRLLTLSCNSQGVIALLKSPFIEPSIPCNACGAWLQGSFAVLTLPDAQDPHVFLHMLINRSPQLGFLWFGALTTGIQNSILKEARVALFIIDLQVAAWTNTLISFIQLPPVLPDPTPSEIPRADEARLMYLSQATDFHDYAPIVPFEPFGATAVKDCLLEVQIHANCKSAHGLYLSGWNWSHENATNVKNTGMPWKQAPCPGTPSGNIVVDYSSLDRDRDRSQSATRSMFMWLRGEDGYPPSERDIYEHEWIDGWSSDEEDAPPEGDGKSSRRRHKRVTPWRLGMTKRHFSM